MGCFASRPSTSTSNNEPPNATSLPHNSSRAAINQPASSPSDPPSRTASSTRPNQPLRPPSPLPNSPSTPPWTRRFLESEREAFFDTRVTGSAEVWSALKLACECLRRGDVAQAQGIVDAVGLNVPDGRVAVGKQVRSNGREKKAGGVFDERGVKYEIPAWVVADPEDVVEEEGEEEKSGQEDVVMGEKGKGREEDLGERVTVRARLSDRGMDVSVSVGMGQTAAVVYREVQEKIGSRKVRLMYLGKVWSENKTLEELGYKEGDVVSAFVFDA